MRQAFALSFLVYKMLRLIPLWSMAFLGLLGAFTVPALYAHNADTIQDHVTQAQTLASNKAGELKAKAGEQLDGLSKLVHEKTGFDPSPYLNLQPAPTVSDADKKNE